MVNKSLENIIQDCLQNFYDRRMNRLHKLDLNKFLKRKNPYLFRAIGTEKASEIVESILSAYISSSDETIFGDAFFEPLAKKVSRGKVSDGEGVDFIMEAETEYKAISLKSGPNIFNSSQKKKQNEQFLSLRSRLYKINKKFDPILGHAYGKLNKNPSGNQIYRDISGQRFWYEITGDIDFYIKIITMMKDFPQKHNVEYQKSWDNAVNKFTKKFIEEYCYDDGSINWEKFTKLVSEDKDLKKEDSSNNSY